MSSPLPKHFEPRGLDSKWCGRWESEGWFSSAPRAGREPYSIVLPPPNVTGTLHMGHAFQHTLMDALSRRARMSGKDTLWQPGVDHAGIATQIVVTRELERAGVDPGTLSREEFLARVWEWKEQSGSEITRQMRRMGASCDWSRERFTMDAGLSRVVTDVFVRLHREGLIYRGKRVINWDPTLLTAVSDLEVSAKEEDGWLHHVRYPFADGDGGVTVATTRPETMLGDTAVAVHPDDERWRDLVGRRVRVPLTGRAVPVVADGFVDPGFGSGCVKITPGHDAADHACSLRHPEIGTLVVFTPDARINDSAPAAYRGLDRLEARRRVVEDLRAQGLLERSEPHRHSPPRGDRSGALLEPMLTDQWFVRARPLAEKALGPTRSGEMSFVPGNWRRVYERWLEDIEDWCISRQLMWGHRIPAWHRADGEVFVARDEREAREAAGEDAALERDPDVLDTWFSSALWPMSTLGWPDADDPHFRAYFPTSALVTGFDIIFFWVARMVMMSVHFTGKAPFREVYITGLVRDAHGEKMSKSKGNTLDPLDLVDGIGLEALVEKRTQGLMNPGLAKEIGSRTRAEYPEGIPAFGADALRLTFASLASYGRDIKFDLGRCAGHRNFCNKLWNAARYVLATAADAGADGGRAPTLADRWIVSRLQRAAAAVSAAFDAYRFDLASQETYQLVWDEYCDWYLEAAKIQIAKGSPEEARSARHTLACVLEAVLRLAHPLIPFVTEELWQQVAPLATGRPASGSILGAPCPVADESRLDAEAEEWMATLKGMVEGCRRLCGEAGASRPTRVEVWVDGDPAALARLEPWFSGLARVSEVHHGGAPEQSIPRFRAGGHEVAVRAGADPAEAAGRLRRRRERLADDIRAVSAKLDNPRFVERAPAEVVGRQRRRLAELREEMALVDGRLGGANAAGSARPDRLAD